ncbi:MAG: hypothetical protein ACTSWD_16955 [Candidatus Heimdallarchaeota archaeon]
MTIEYKDSKRIVGLSTDIVETVTYTGDMSTGWGTSNAGSGFTLDGVTEEIDFLNNYTNDNVSIDLDSLVSGGSLSTSKWLIRFTYQTNGTASGDNIIWWNGVSSVETVISNSTINDFVGFSTQTLNGTTNTRTYLSMGDNDALHSTDVQTRLQLSGSNSADLVANNTSYYAEISRDGSNFTVKVYSDSTYSTLIGEKTNATPTGTLRYFIVANYQQGSNVTGTLSEFKFYNGVSSLTAKPTDVPDNSILVEKDTAKRYWFDAESAGADTTTSNTNVNDIAHFEGTVGANYIIGEQITSGNALIGKTITSLSFWLYKLNSGSSGTETFTFGVWNSSGTNVHEFGTVTRGELPQGSAFGNAVKFTKSTGSYVLQENDIFGLRTDSNPNSAWTVEITQRDSNVYSDGQRAIFVQDATPVTSAKDVGFEVVSHTVTPATWTKDRQVTSGSAMTAGGGTGGGGTTNAQTSSNYVWTNIASISTARQYTFGTGNASNFTIGGANSVENSETWNGSSWATAISTDTQRRDTTATAGSYNDMIVAYGRNNAGTLLNSSSTFNGTTWSAGVTANTAREHPCGAGQSDSMLIAGGYESGGTSNKVDSYNGTTFTTETVLPTASYGQNMGASASNSAHIAGGNVAMSGTYDGTTWTNTTELSVSTTHYFAGGGGDRDEHLVMGGYTPSSNNYDTTWLWDGTSWVSKNALTISKRGGAGDCTAR